MCSRQGKYLENIRRISVLQSRASLEWDSIGEKVWEEYEGDDAENDKAKNMKRAENENVRGGKVGIGEEIEVGKRKYALYGFPKGLWARSTSPRHGIYKLMRRGEKEMQESTSTTHTQNTMNIGCCATTVHHKMLVRRTGSACTSSTLPHPKKKHSANRQRLGSKKIALFLVLFSLARIFTLFR
jgi:hypothetical protein